MPLRRLLPPLILLGLLAPAGAQAAPASSTATRAAWDRVPARTLQAAGKSERVAPARYAAFTLDPAGLRTALEGTSRSGEGRTVAVPTPDGGFERFAVRATSVMEPGLAAAHPEIATYAGRSLDHPGAEGRFELTPMAFTGSVRGGQQPTYYVDPAFPGDATDHVAYRRTALADPRPEDSFIEREAPEVQRAAAATQPPARVAGQAVVLRTYRLALLSDPSYAANDGSRGQTTAAKVVLMDRVNQIYEDDLAIRMVLIDATDKLNLDTPAQATGTNGPCGAAACYADDDLASCSSALLDRNDTVAGLLAGARNYDIGHIVLGKNGGGIAGLGVVGTALKAEGCTGIPRPVGDYFAVDYVAHEMGHEFGGNHTFGGDQLNCSLLNRNASTSVEPGSGSSVMAYAGICGQDNLQPHSDPYFSQRSIDELIAEYGVAGEDLDSIQQTAFRGLTAAGSYKLTYGAKTTSTLTGASTAAQIEAAIDLILPVGQTVTVGGDPLLGEGVQLSGYDVEFGGTLAGKPAGLLGLTALSSGVTGFVGETQAGGHTTEGGSATTTTNHAPAVMTTPAYTLPLRTPFTLTATGSDQDAGDVLTYLWEQNDASPVSDPIRGLGPGTLLVTNAKTFGALFRVFGTAARYPEPETYLNPSPGENLATGNPVRDLPDVQQVEADNTNALTGQCATVTPSQYDPVMGMLLVQGGKVSDDDADCLSEFLPTAGYAGPMHFRVTARDDHAGFGGVTHADTTLTLAPGAGPFRITAPARNVVYPPTTASAPSAIPVTWDVANTDVAPVGVANVKILLSTDGGRTFGTVLAASTPNDGTQSVTLPVGLTTDQGRIRIEAVGNVFYDASRGTITIADSSLPPNPATPTSGAGTTTTTPAATVTETQTTPAPPAPAPVTVTQTTPAATAPPVTTTTPGPAGPTGTTPTGTIPAAFTASLAVDKGLRRTALTRGVRYRLRCSGACTTSVRVTVDAATRKALGLRSAIVARSSVRFTKAARTARRLRLTKAVARPVLARSGAKLTLTATVTHAGTVRTLRRTITLTGRL